MKILHINSYYSAGKFYKNLYNQQVKDGLDIDVFVPVNNSFQQGDFDYGEYTTISENHNKFDRYIFHIKHHKILKDITKKYDINKYSLIHAHSLFSNGYVAMKVKEQFGVPYIVAVRNTDFYLFLKKMIHLRKMGIEILKNADKLVFLSKAYRDAVIKEYVPESIQKNLFDKSEVIPNCIDEFWFDNIGIPKRIRSNNEIKLLQIGDINRNKNIETTVKAIELLINKGYKVKLDVVGKVKDQKVFDVIKDMYFVNYLGYKSKEELIQIYRDNDIFILPSIHETFGLVYAEALSQGLPVIYTSGQGFDGQFQDGEVGYCVNCYDYEEISNKVLEIITKYETISSKAVNGVQKFKWDNIAKDYLDVYNNVLRD